MSCEERLEDQVGTEGQEVRDSEIRVFRIHIRPGGDAGRHPEQSFTYCLQEGVLGIGWGVEVPEGVRLTWNEYERLALLRHKNIRIVRYLFQNVRPGDLLWTRDHQGKYYLARATGGWEYRSTLKGYEADVLNVVPCDIKGPIPIGDVPGALINHFRSRRTLQRIKNLTLIEYTKLLWNKLINRQVFTVDQLSYVNIFDLLDDMTLEDVVFLYLQVQGWLVLANSRKADTMQYELALVHRDSKEWAVVQVKGGNTPLFDGEYSEYVGKGAVHKVFLFQAHGNYQGTPQPGVYRIQPDDLLNFMLSHRELHTGSARHWLDFLTELRIK